MEDKQPAEGKLYREYAPAIMSQEQSWLAIELVCPFCRLPMRDTDVGGACDLCGRIYVTDKRLFQEGTK